MTSMEKLTPEIEEYLDDLRESGETNMYGAGVYLRRDFCFNKRESHKVLHQWMLKKDKEDRENAHS